MKKPWNRTDHPVYAVSSTDGAGAHNMHIATYITAISMRPKRYICGIYYDTLSHEYISKTSILALQLLSAPQYRLVDLLGRHSGRTTDKMVKLAKRNLLTDWKEFKVLSDAVFVLAMTVIDSVDAGDHVALLCEVSSYRNLTDGEPLTLDLLREKKLIRN